MGRVEPLAETFGLILRERAERHPEERAFVYLRDGETDEETLSYGELHERACRFGSALERSVEAGARALLLMPPDLDYVAALFGCFYANVVGVSAAPPHPKRLHRTLPRLLAIAADADPACVLTTPAIRDAAAGMLVEGQPLSGALWLTEDDGEAAVPRRTASGGSELAFLQYTSGSTGDPRGVQLSHANLISNCGMIGEAFDLRLGRDLGFSWLPPYHDMGLIGGILQPVFHGGCSVLTSPLAILKRPMRWLEGISRYRATTSGGPNFAYDLCTARFEPDRAGELDLSCWRVAFNGAEPIRPRTLDDFSERFGRFGFRQAAFLPCYGLAEATLMVTAAGHEEPPASASLDSRGVEGGRGVPAAPGEKATRLIGCGTPAPPHELAIVDPRRLRRCGPGRIGEIWVAGPGVALGYWDRPEETEEVFGASIAGEPGSRFLRTGDLGVVVDGQLYVVGRIKDMLIVNGRNIYPQDIEQSAEAAHDSLRAHCSAAFGAEGDGGTELTIVMEVDGPDGVDGEEVAAAVRRRVARDLDLRLDAVVLCTEGSVPKTTSGKVQRRLCRTQAAEGTLAVVAESALAEAA